jgi:hypothetical protein
LVIRDFPFHPNFLCAWYACHIRSVSKGISVVMTRIHGQKLSLIVPQAEIARALACLINQPVISASTGVHVVILTQGKDRSLWAKNPSQESSGQSERKLS